MSEIAIIAISFFVFGIVVGIPITLTLEKEIKNVHE